MKNIAVLLLTFLSLQAVAQQLTNYSFSNDGFNISAGFPGRPSKKIDNNKNSKMLTLTEAENGVTYALIVTNTESNIVASQSATNTAQKLWSGAKQRDVQQSSYVAGTSSTYLKYISSNGTYITSHTFSSGIMMCQAMVLQKNNYVNDNVAGNFFSTISFSGYTNNNNQTYNPPTNNTPSNNNNPSTTIGNYEKNQRVEVWDGKTNKWFGAVVLKVNSNKTYRISFDGYAENYDEDVTTDRIRNMTTTTVSVNAPYIQLKKYGKTTVDGNLSSGYTMEDLSWATTSQLACWPSIRDVEFQGKHVGYWFDLPEKSVVKITVTPKRKDRRINIYGYAGFDLKTIPPQLPYTNICEASHPEWIGQPNLSEPSKPQTIQFNTTTRRTTIYFAVAGARNVWDGDYTISIDID
jgi:hypothetical protein